MDLKMANATTLNIFSNKLKTVVNNENTESIRLNVGDIVANHTYLVLDKLSTSSGEADLYKVQDLRNKSECVLKLYRRKDAVKAEILNKLAVIHNPNIASLLDKGVIQEFPYIVIPFYSNNSLGSYVEQGIRFSLDELKGLIIPSIAEGLKVLHDEGIIHKDLKPSNLMVSNDEQHIVLIDFGISSVTNGNTVVVTQTGKSPFYSAPETNTGLFLADSDYYSLGITLYELATGYTPYQNINIENLAGFQQIQKIPFPKEFDPELKDLIEGLTYKDITNRNDKANPNRRWGYEEIQKWLKGEKQQIPGQIGTSSQSTVSTTGSTSIENQANINRMPYSFNDETYYDNKLLIESMLINWELGKKDFYRGILGRHYELCNDMHSLNICKQEEHLYQLRPEDNEIPFMTAMYSLEPTITKLYWNGFVFDSLEAYGLALLSELKKEKPNEDLINSATVMLQNGVLKNYIRLTNVENKELYLEFISKNNELLQVKALSPVEQAIYLLNGLANKKSFMIEGKYFENVQSYSSFLAELYKDNLLDYKNYFGRNINEITAIKEFIKGDGAKQLDYYKKQADDIVCIKEQAFENVQSFIAFLAKLYEDNCIRSLLF